MATVVQFRVGTSGWQYDDWRPGLYPAGVGQPRWLGVYSASFSTVEINSAFYRLPDRRQFERWASAVTPGFCFAVKASRYLTHVQRLREPAGPVQRLMERTEGLGDKTGPVLLQLPPTLHEDVDALDATLRAFPRSTRVAVEFRHRSWDTPAVRGVLERRGAATVMADRRGPLEPWWSTADWGYVRFHEGRARPTGCYGRVAIEQAAQRLAERFSGASTVWIYFNNDRHGCAVSNARALRRRLSAAGHRVA